MRTFLKAFPCAALAMTMASACASLGGGERYAVFAEDTDMDSVKAQLASALGRASVTLGEGDPRDVPQLVVLPPPPGPMESRSTVVPMVFDIKRDGDACILSRRDDGMTVSLEGVTCKPA
ncbi:hypothetical protein [Parvularcula lutaonensis]|uniref:Lipoprotein n=1 Tax=Parvularcula lutaonensis TaxID=491923 RepID=A0ABV7M9T1_9PROT|nr:hypothetical protein [Parvularcula lutaonensis]GGY44104.1 hypothetical protein GCM10007148_11250 [Parvularcula lutaonensis]